MGAYLSRPETEKKSVSGFNKWLSYGSSSMQGWRRNQEDAHNCLLDFDPRRAAAFFAVYDGHGGAEVSQYCASHLPTFLLNHNDYINSGDLTAPINPTDILRNIFVEFDTTLTSDEVKTELKKVANPDGEDAQKNWEEDDDDDEEDDDGIVPETIEEVSALHDEAKKPLESVLLNKYGDDSNIPEFIQHLLSNLNSKSRKIKNGEHDESGQDKEAVPGPSSSESTTTIEFKKTNTSDGETTTSVTVKEHSIEHDILSSGSSSDPPVITHHSAADQTDDKTEDKTEGIEVPVFAEDADMDDEDEEDDEDFEPNDVIFKDAGEDSDDDEDDDDEDDEEDEEEDDENDDEFDEEGEDGGKYITPRPLAYNDPGVDSGTTACCALLLPELDESGNGEGRVSLYVANAGDSRAVLCRAGAAIDLSVDHKPEDPEEKARIQAAGGYVTAEGRVNDGLNLSRAIGDHVYKWRKDLKMSDQMISALPDVTRTELIPGVDEFVVIACDGIWNSMTSQEVVDFVYDHLHPDQCVNESKPTVKQAEDEKSSDTNDDSRNKSDDDDDEKKETEEKDKKKEAIVVAKDPKDPAFLSGICEALFEKCLAPNTMGDGTGCDNMTCIILRLDNLKEMAQSAVTRITSETKPSPAMASPVPPARTNERKRSESANWPSNAAEMLGQTEVDEVTVLVQNNATGDYEESTIAVSTVVNGNGSGSPLQKKPRTESSSRESSSPESHVQQQPVNGSTLS